MSNQNSRRFAWTEGDEKLFNADRQASAGLRTRPSSPPHLRLVAKEKGEFHIVAGQPSYGTFQAGNRQPEYQGNPRSINRISLGLPIGGFYQVVRQHHETFVRAQQTISPSRRRAFWHRGDSSTDSFPDLLQAGLSRVHRLGQNQPLRFADRDELFFDVSASQALRYNADTSRVRQEAQDRHELCIDATTSQSLQSDPSRINQKTHCQPALYTDRDELFFDVIIDRSLQKEQSVDIRPSMRPAETQQQVPGTTHHLSSGPLEHRASGPAKPPSRRPLGDNDQTRTFCHLIRRNTMIRKHRTVHRTEMAQDGAIAMEQLSSAVVLEAHITRQPRCDSHQESSFVEETILQPEITFDKMTAVIESDKPAQSSFKNTSKNVSGFWTHAKDYWS